MAQGLYHKITNISNMSNKKQNNIFMNKNYFNS